MRHPLCRCFCESANYSHYSRSSSHHVQKKQKKQNKNSKKQTFNTQVQKTLRTVHNLLDHFSISVFIYTEPAKPDTNIVQLFENVSAR